ncbi:MAG TPA: thiamine pyrophosphate-dependent enzyme, partial [Actinomycetota bacterium]|nr:thiamine pyrophosphate-dependent enzyme [Actinomycetota bacterium]
GFPGIRVDGNDVLAVYRATREATERARADGMPTLIEAVTYRMGPHSTADDRSRYQPEEEIERWRGLDPLFRFRKYLEAEGAIDHGFVEQVEADAGRLAAEIRAGIVGATARDAREIFEWAFTELPPTLARQRDEVSEAMEPENEGGARGG